MTRLLLSSILEYSYMTAKMDMEPVGNRSGGGRSRSAKALDHLQAGLRERLDGLAEDNRRLKQSAQLARELLQALSRLGEAPDLAAFCDQALETFIRMFGLRGAAISVVEKHGASQLSFARHRGPEALEPDDLVFEVDSSLSAALREAGRPLLVADLVGKTGPRSKERSVLRRLECEVVVPLMRGNRLLGLLLLTRRTDRSLLQAGEIGLLASCSSYLSIVVENILLHARRP